ncbi:MAG: hypothetical protein FWF19_01635, partial [Euryarchaeota archaeon]|nr:hypothetical protein [Euryarchaeota archaeon]
QFTRYSSIFIAIIVMIFGNPGEQQKALHAVLTCENPQKALKQIAEDAMTMPQILLDQINDIAMPILDDILIDFMKEQPYILDEYAPSLKISISKEKSL